MFVFVSKDRSRSVLNADSEFERLNRLKMNWYVTVISKLGQFRRFAELYDVQTRVHSESS